MIALQIEHHARPFQATRIDPTMTHQDRTVRRGFSLIEIMVVVAILALLLAIGVAVKGAVTRTAKRAATTSRITTLQAAEEEYKAKTSTVVNHLASVDYPFDWGDPVAKNVGGASGEASLGGNEIDDVKEQSIQRFIWVVYQVPDAASVLSRERDALTDRDSPPDGDGFLEVRDAWDSKIVYAAFVDHEDAAEEDDFLPERGKLGVPKPFFASAGPDGLWGHVADVNNDASDDRDNNSQADRDNDGDGTDDHLDNLYSFEAQD